MHWVSSAFLSNESFAIIACRTRNSGTLSEFLVDWHIEFSKLTPMYVKRFSFRIKQIGPLILEQLKIRSFAWPIMVLGEARKQHSTRGSSLGSYSEIESNKQRKASEDYDERKLQNIYHKTYLTYVDSLPFNLESIDINKINIFSVLRAHRQWA